jgi:HAE1 family hydrophobic/amphiphilic exporter-1
MKGLYSKPLRVYLILGVIALCGLLSGLQLPISLFPMSNQPVIEVGLSYGSLSAQQFFESIGKSIEAKLRGVKVFNQGIESVVAEYHDQNVQYQLKFAWGVDPEEARRATEVAATSVVAGREQSITRSLSVYTWRQNQGFLALSFYSPLRSLDDLYETLNPLITPIAGKVPDAASLNLYNPSFKEITVKLSPEKLSLYQVTTMQIENAIREAVTSLGGGTMKMGQKEMQIVFPKLADSVESLGFIRVSSSTQKPVLLKDVAQISTMVSKSSTQKFKTSGVESLILFAQPKDGGNIKNMADDIMRELKLIESQWPKDIEYKILVNPSDFINESIISVLREVGVAALLAVIVLFLFIGSFKNVATAAIEIPLSLVMAFLLMRLTGMNLNLISLAGLALSAGMNVDASVVVLENIFRHFEGKPRNLSYSDKLNLIIKAVEEVRVPIVASTIASLVVFLPLVFTKGLTNSLLGDLAKAVIFSHGLSAVVALILVPTIRLQILKRGEVLHIGSPIEGFILKIENFYKNSLSVFLNSKRAQQIMFVSLLVALPLLIGLVIPNLPKEVIGRPETDWLIAGISSPVINTTKEMESEISDLEADLTKKYGSEFKYTFTQIMGPTNGMIMLRLNSRKKVDELASKLEEDYKNTPSKFYFVEKWNPSELRIPDPPEMRLEIIGGSGERRLQVSEDLLAKFADQGVYDKVNANPPAQRSQLVSIDMLNQLNAGNETLPTGLLSHYLRTATDGLYIDDLNAGLKSYPIYMRFPEERTASLAEIRALPIGLDGKLIPLGAFAQFRMQAKQPEIYRENQTAMVLISGRLNKSNKGQALEHQRKSLDVIAEQRRKLEDNKDIPATEKPALNVALADQELREALDQLRMAVIISAILVFLIMIIQLGDIVQASLVMVAIPLGIIGVIVSLFVFQSSLSLNSGLGTILLNGIAVANSIILVDFIQKLFTSGKTAHAATVEASSTRLRPILMTSLTTGLGMLPIALGLGEGGKILQPLGIAVCGGLWFSTLMTLYVVPALQYHYLKRKELKSGSVLFNSGAFSTNLGFEESTAVSDQPVRGELSKSDSLSQVTERDTEL